MEEKKLKKNKVTICVVNYKTEQVIRLCLRCIRKFTKYPYEVIVVDNGSGDNSIKYLRTLRWITLIERPGLEITGSMAHGTALDAGLKNTETEYFLAMHSDTIIHNYGWLDYMVQQINQSEKTACAGSGKIDLKPKWQVWLKKATDFRAWMKKYSSPKPQLPDLYIRTICAIYKTDLLRKENLRFAMNVEQGVTCGKQLYFELLNRGYETNIISEYIIAEYIYHLAHATMVFNNEFFVTNNAERKCKARLEKIINSEEIKAIMADKSLDK